MQHADLIDSTPVFQIKGSMIAATVLELSRVELEHLELQLAEKVSHSPRLFHETPLVLGLDRLTEADAPLDLQTVLAICKRLNLHLVAVRGGRPDDLSQASGLGLPLLPPTRQKERVIEPSAEDLVAPPKPVPVVAEARASKIITQPVRGGQQIYAEGGDLIILAPVSAGAEVIADGNVHVYAPLRGRALAGVKGDTNARIFCRDLGAELVAIAGHYKVADELKAHGLWGKPAQISLANGELNIVDL